MTPDNIAAVTALTAHVDGFWAALQMRDGRSLVGGLIWRPGSGEGAVLDPCAETRHDFHVNEIEAVVHSETPSWAKRPPDRRGVVPSLFKGMA